jgi:acyl dehydratase
MAYYFEDLVLGAVFTAGPIILERDDLVAFATRYDPQPQHLDETQAATSVFGELVASGWQTAAITMRLLIDGASPKMANGFVGAGIDQIAWPTPVRPGDALSASSEIVELRPSRSRPDRGLMKLRTTTTNQHGRTVQIITASIIVPRRAPAVQN